MGCEFIYGPQTNWGCYGHTYEVARANGAEYHTCWIKTRNQLLVLVRMDSASRVTVVIKTLTSFVQVIIGPTFVPVPVKTGVTTKQESLVVNSSGDNGIMVVTLTIQLSLVEMASVNTIVGLQREEILEVQKASC